jgi:hypothetical protein
VDCVNTAKTQPNANVNVNANVVTADVHVDVYMGATMQYTKPAVVQPMSSYSTCILPLSGLVVR